MTIPRQGVHTASELRRSTRRLDRCLASVDQILGAMRRGEALHLQYENNMSALVTERRTKSGRKRR